MILNSSAASEPPRPRPATGSPAPASTRDAIGFSAEERPIQCEFRGRHDAPLKVLIIAGQHGDERPARQSLQAVLRLPSRETRTRLPATRIAAVLDANPDGSAARSRCNAEGIDLNRDHQLLLSRETTAIHQFARRWQPQVILDLHSYPSRRRHLLARNVVLDHDVFLDVPNHPALAARPANVDGTLILRELLEVLGSRQVRAGRYTLVRNSGRARHSTADVVDARNGLALRCGAMVLLVENRQPRREDDAAERLRLRAAQERALWTVLEWLDKNADHLADALPVALPQPGSTVPVYFKYAESGRALRLPCRDATRGEPATVRFRRYLDSHAVMRTVALPAGYAVPANVRSVLDVLRRHGFDSLPGQPGELRLVQRLRIERARPSRRPGRAAREIVLSAHPTRMALDRYEIFPTSQPCGDALAVFLEPESKHGLHRYDLMEIPLVPSSWFPVLRVLHTD